MQIYLYFLQHASPMINNLVKKPEKKTDCMSEEFTLATEKTVGMNIKLLIFCFAMLIKPGDGSAIALSIIVYRALKDEAEKQRKNKTCESTCTSCRTFKTPENLVDGCFRHCAKGNVQVAYQTCYDIVKALHGPLNQG
ncbi:hypothetical protein CAPTEDRAFT_204515 [Capitella teleta]|uniref:Uncharacterized protein n=1 Tax=Capitella teleta TaxID=283909 RepID=R7U5F5_CAPTE|nr:hypothetical protein CAPTEDRAFT_204515 [Capitella teleta]|eukprot:ELT98360.1 hypothetical protein CAPTEDRAFT_204515 [Capitella teleta]